MHLCQLLLVTTVVVFSTFFVDVHAKSESSKQVYCAYFSQTGDPNNIAQGGDSDEVLGEIQPDNSTVLCTKDTGRCYTLWYSRPGHDDEMIISKQGCWSYHDSIPEHTCNDPTCISSAPPIVSLKIAHNITSRFCCCKGDYCNANVTDNWVPKPSTEAPLTVTPVYVQRPAMTNEVQRTIIIAVIPLFCISVVIALLYLAFRLRVRTYKHQDGLTMIEATPMEPSFDIEQLKIMNQIGEGRYCHVYKGVLNERDVAVKIFDGASRGCYANELDIYSLAHIEHENVLKFIGASERMGQDGWMEFLMVVELMPYGALMGYLRENTYDWHSMCRLAQTMAAGLAHLHQSVCTGSGQRPAVVHRDVNSRNILVKPDYVCVLGDLGFSMKVAGAQVVRDGDGGDPHTITDVGTVRYMSPEVLDGAVNLRDCESALKQVDIYAMGLVLWEIACRCKDLFPNGDIGDYKMPYQDEIGSHPRFEEMQALVSRDRKRPAFPDAWKENNQALRSLKETMEDCWDHDAEARLTALCVEERIIELMVLWNKHKTVSPTINPTSQGLTLPNYSETDSHVTITRDGTELSSRVDIPTHLVMSIRPPSCAEAMNGDIASGDVRLPRSSGPMEKNERQRLLSPDTISTSLSNHSDLNLIDLALVPSVDPKNIHHSDESIERFTTDLKFGRPASISGDTSEGGYGMSEPTTSPSQPLVMHEMRPSLARDQMTDNLGGRSKQQNQSNSLNRPTSLPMWGHLTVNEARARATNIYSSLADNLGSHQKTRNPAKSDTNKHRQQARAAAVAAASTEHKTQTAQQTHPDPLIERSTSQNSIGSIGSYHSTSGESECSSGSDHSRRPTTLPLPPNGHGSKKRLVAVYMPDVGPSAKVQTGIAKMDSVHPQCHAVKMATNGIHSKSKADPCKSVDMNGAHACEIEHLNPRGKRNTSTSDSLGASLSGDDRMSDDSQSEQSGSAETSLLQPEQITEAKKGRRRGTPYRIGSNKLSVNKGDKLSSGRESNSQDKLNSSVCDEHNINNNARSNTDLAAETAPMQNGHAIVLENGTKENGVPNNVTGNMEIENSKSVADNMYTLDSQENNILNSSQEGAAPQGSFQVSCV